MASSLGHAFKKILNHGSQQSSQQSSQPAPQQQQQQQQWSQPGPPPMMSGGGSSSMRTVGYFPSWSIYDRSYKPQQIPASSLTHLLYCFADVKTDSGQVVLTDAWADEQIHYEGDSWDEPGNNLYGNIKAIFQLKKQHRQLKLLLSIGGWTFSPNFAPVARDPRKRAAFVQSATDLVKDYGLDGLDIDWEYPQDASQAKDYVSLLGELRQSLDGLAANIGCPPNQPFELTIAAPCGMEQAKRLRIAEMDRYLTFWNLMAYDMAGSWDSVAGHQAPLYNRGGPCVDEAVRLYRSAGVAPQKLVLGMPLYGRAFENTNGPGHPFQGTGPGSWEDGSWDYKALPLAGSNEYYDQQLVAASCYDGAKRKFVTYDNAQSASTKAAYIKGEGLGGAMWWELSGDRNDHGSIVRRVAHELGSLDGSPNHLAYPTSKWDNLRSNRI